jgi:hypothetical protein
MADRKATWAACVAFLYYLLFAAEDVADGQVGPDVFLGQAQ